MKENALDIFQTKFVVPRCKLIFYYRFNIMNLEKDDFSLKKSYS